MPVVGATTKQRRGLLFVPVALLLTWFSHSLLDVGRLGRCDPNGPFYPLSWATDSDSKNKMLMDKLLDAFLTEQITPDSASSFWVSQKYTGQKFVGQSERSSFPTYCIWISSLL